MDYKKRKQELEEKFEKIQKEIALLENVLNGKKQEILLLKGQWQAFDEMEKNIVEITEENKKV